MAEAGAGPEAGQPSRHIFRYRAREAVTGRVRTGERVGEDAYTVRAALRRVGLDVERIEAVDTGAAPGWLGPLREAWQARQRRRRRPVRADLCDALVTMLEAGLTMEGAIATLAASDVRDAAQRRMLVAMREELRAGAQLSEACAAHPGWFSPLDVAMLRAGQQGGNLTETLRSLAELHQRAGVLAHKLFTALAYPVLLLVLAVAVVVFLSLQTLPQLVGMLEDAGVEPPLLTRALIAVGRFLAWRWYLALAVLVGGIGLLRIVLGAVPSDSRTGRLLARSLPARVRRRSRVADLAATLSRLLGSGIPLAEALRVAGRAADSRTLARLLAEAGEGVRGGKDFSELVAASHLLDPEFAQLVQVGEESGELPAVLARIAERYRRAADRALDRLTALLEPVAVLSIAALIGLVVFAAILPLLAMNQVI